MAASYDDLRDFISAVEAIGSLRHVHGAEANLELGAITEVAAGKPDGPALLFDDIKGFKKGFRVFTNSTVQPRRAALALGIDPSLSPLQQLKEWKSRRSKLVMIEPVAAKEALFLQNSQRGDAVDLSLFPAPVWHQKDGGPYIGSGSLIIMRDPDTGWVNSSIYRVQVHSRNRVTVQFDHTGRHGSMIAQKYWDRGQSCPVAVVGGIDPALFISGVENLHQRPGYRSCRWATDWPSDPRESRNYP